ncbi:hypothetical protein [Streptacidiphilus monticola]|uniref:Secreted protein n=1 Tax=Streptacidiphilus monticola TaxID=2161674 RepID=A0ABW1G308_9ACTN
MARFPRRALVTGVAALGLALTAAGCSDPSEGTVTATNGRIAEQVTSPNGQHCHNFVLQDVHSVNNNLLADILLYDGPDCTTPAHGKSYYLARGITTTDFGRVWRSFSVVGQ